MGRRHAVEVSRRRLRRPLGRAAGRRDRDAGLRQPPLRARRRRAAAEGRERDGGYAGLSDSIVDLRVDEHERPLEDLRRIYLMHQAIFGKTPSEDWLGVDDALAAELRERLGRLGFQGELDAAFNDWAGKE